MRKHMYVRRWLSSVLSVVAVGSILLVVFTTRLAAQQPYGFRYVRTDSDPSQVIYDRLHRRFYVAVPGTHEVIVVSAVDGTVVAKLPVVRPANLSLSPDASKLYVGSRVVQDFYVIDTATLAVVDFPQIRIPTTLQDMGLGNKQNAPYQASGRNDGTILFIAGEIGVTGSGLFRYDPGTGISERAENTSSQEPYFLRTSGDGNRAAIMFEDTSGTVVGIYDYSAGNYSVRGPVYDEQERTYTARDLAVNADGTQFLIDGHLLYNDQLQRVADLNANFAGIYYHGSAFSPDGSTIYSATNYSKTVSLPGGGTGTYNSKVILVSDASTGQTIGYIPSLVNNNLVTGMAISDTGMGILLTDDGFAEFDLTKRVASLPAEVNQGEWPNVEPSSGSSTQPTAVKIKGVGFRSGAEVSFGNAARVSASVVSEGELQVQAPSPASPGPVDVSVVFPDGWAMYAPQAFSYGPVVLSANVDAGPTSGGTKVTLFGYGLTPGGNLPRITLRGVPATVAVEPYGRSPYMLPIQGVTFTTPPNETGWADVVITTSEGSYTMKNGFQYLTHELVPNVFPRRMVFDETRNAVYVIDQVSGDVVAVDLATLNVRTLLVANNEPSTSLAVTPDGSRLLVVSATGRTLKAIDPASGSVIKNILITSYFLGASDGSDLVPTEVIATSRGTAIVALWDRRTVDSGAVLEFDMKTGTYIVVDGAAEHTLLARSRDGGKIFMAPDGGCDVRIWDSTRRALLSETHCYWERYSLSASATGDRVLLDDVMFAFDSSRVELRQKSRAAFTTELYTQNPEYARGWELHPSGGLSYLPSTVGVEIYDTNTGKRALSIGVEGGAASTIDALAIDSAGRRLFLAEMTGMGILTIEDMPVSIGSVVPARCIACEGDIISVFGSGFLPGATVTIGGNTLPAEVLDSTLLTFRMPLVEGKKHGLRVNNPGGQSYTLPAALDATALPAAVVPFISSISPSIVAPGTSNVITVNGTGFGADSQVHVGGNPVKTAYANSTQIGGFAFNLMGPWPLAITVVNTATGTSSNAVNLDMNEPSPKIIKIWPESIAAGTGDFLLYVAGNGTFSPNSVVRWNGASRQTTFANPSLLIANINAADITAQGSANIYVYTPGADESISNSLLIAITEQNPLVKASPTSVGFGVTIVGTESTRTVELTSLGNVPAQISSVAISDTLNFSQTNTCLFRTIQPNDTCRIDVKFSPAERKKAGDLFAELRISSNSTGGLITVPLTGTAIDFALEAKSTSVSVKAGQNAIFELSVLGYGPITNTVYLKCTELPQGSFWSASNTVVTPSANGTPITITVTTSSQMANIGPVQRSKGSIFALSLALVPGFIVAFYGKRIHGGVLWILCLATLSLAMVTCGGGGGSGTTPQPPPPPPPPTSKSYKMTLVGEASGTERSIDLTITVQK